MSKQPHNKVLVYKKKNSARRYAADKTCSQGQVAEKEKVGVEEEEAGRVSKD